MASLVSECFVKPKYQIEESKQPHYLGPYDLIILARQYMQKGLLFTNPPTFVEGGIDSFLKNLKTSLSLALVHFYPLAGRLETIKYEDEHRCWIYVDCNKGSGARFIHAKETSFLFSVNCRSRLNPPLSSYQFGNFVTRAQGKCKVKELLGSGLGSAASLLHQAIAAEDDQSIRNRLNAYIKAPFVTNMGWTSLFGPVPIVVGGSTRFDMYSPKFGLGVPAAIRSGYGNKFEGNVSAHPGYEGAGSVDLSIYLAAETISKLESDQEFMSFVSSTQDSN